MSLINLVLSPKIKSKVVAQKVAVQKFVNADALKPLGNIKPLQNPGLQGSFKSNVVQVDYNARDYYIQVIGIMTKYPHYKFVAKVKSGELNKIKYWFKDTKRNVTVIYSYKDMEKELNRAVQGGINLKEQGFEPTEIKEQFIPKFGILDGIDLDNLRIVKYTMYKLAKYCTIKPFDTNINYALKEKFDYTNNGMGI